eukprot:TRINITY_DN17035_c0_g1_i1.p1 TRINITY_DN17035_c0_g1~~TRINITY_DN17035_c0_g1_i1.p1  ORF type:complete len:106 (-),score=14.74 TRINITY_DN17035_c0_g1_i1:107-424(-)
MSLKTIGGFIDENGSPITKIGDYSISRDLNVGIYTITFNTPFENEPAVTASQVYNNDPSFTMGDTRDNVCIVCITNSYMKLKTGDSVGQGSWRKFTFLAIGVQND